MDFQLDEKVALATGASKGIGRYVAGHLAAEGTEVAITARTPGPLEPPPRRHPGDLCGPTAWRGRGPA